jgi:hypothetical protein
MLKNIINVLLNLNPDNQDSDKYVLNVKDLPAILRKVGLGAAVAALAYVIGFMSDQVEWGIYAAIVASTVIPALESVKQWIEDHKTK